MVKHFGDLDEVGTISGSIGAFSTSITISGLPVSVGGGGAGTPGGSNTQIQFNDAGSFGGDAGLTYDKTTDTLSSVAGAFSTSLTVSGVPVPTRADTLRITFLSYAAAGGVGWSNLPIATGFFNATGHQQLVDLTTYTQLRLVINRQSINGSPETSVAIRGSDTLSAVPTDYISLTTNGSPTVLCSGQNTGYDSGWQTILPERQKEQWLAIVGSGGNGVLDPIFGSIVAYGR